MNKIVSFDNFLIIYNASINRARIEYLDDFSDTAYVLSNRHICKNPYKLYTELKDLKIDIRNFQTRDINDLTPIIDFLNQVPDESTQTISYDVWESLFQKDEKSTIKVSNRDFGVSMKAVSDATKIMNLNSCNCTKCRHRCRE